MLPDDVSSESMALAIIAVLLLWFALSGCATLIICEPFPMSADDCIEIGFQ
jgi:hypothetical protein